MTTRGLSIFCVVALTLLAAGCSGGESAPQSNGPSVTSQTPTVLSAPAASATPEPSPEQRLFQSTQVKSTEEIKSSGEKSLQLILAKGPSMQVVYAGVKLYLDMGLAAYDASTELGRNNHMNYIGNAIYQLSDLYCNPSKGLNDLQLLDTIVNLRNLIASEIASWKRQNLMPASFNPAFLTIPCGPVPLR